MHIELLTGEEGSRFEKKTVKALRSIHVRCPDDRNPYSGAGYRDVFDAFNYITDSILALYDHLGLKAGLLETKSKDDK